MNEWLMERAKEASTWRGVTLALGAAGVGISPDLQNAIIAAVGSVLGLIEVLRRERR